MILKQHFSGRVTTLVRMEGNVDFIFKMFKE
jgi:hypothetical protein